MDGITALKRDQIPAYTGPHTIPGIRFRAARDLLGVSAWGMNIIELDPDCGGYPVHDHLEDGQEEVYVVLEGSAVLVIGDAERVVTAGELIRVAPHVKRGFVTRETGVVLLAIGGTPGQAYTPGIAG